MSVLLSPDMDVTALIHEMSVGLLSKWRERRYINYFYC